MSRLGLAPIDEPTRTEYWVVRPPVRRSAQADRRKPCYSVQADSPLAMDCTTLRLGHLASTSWLVLWYPDLTGTATQSSYRAVRESAGQLADPLAELERLSQLVSAAWKPGKSALQLLRQGRR